MSQNSAILTFLTYFTYSKIEQIPVGLWCSNIGQKYGYSGDHLYSTIVTFSKTEFIVPYRSDLFVSGTTHGPGNLMTVRVNKKVTIRFVLRHNSVVLIIYFSATAQYPQLASHLTPNWSLCSCQLSVVRYLWKML